MKRREFIVLLGSAAIALPIPARAEPAEAATAIADRLVGSWTFVSAINTRSDGSSFDRWGANPRGTLMLDGQGHFVQVIMGSESRLFGAKSFFAYGTYTVDEADKTILLHTEVSSNSRLNGSKQRRTVVSLTGDELKLINRNNSAGNTVESVWHRMR